MARRRRSFITWLETHWVAPAYAGGVLLGLAISFFGAAINSMAGWLYAISGVMLAIAGINIWSSPRSLRGLQIHRQPVRPISVGEALSVVITLDNLTTRPKTLLQVRDLVPEAFGPWPETAIAVIAPHQKHQWAYTCYPTQRGLYHWPTLALRTAGPFGLFWCQRPQAVAAHATVYPTILPLSHCPLIDQMGVATGTRWEADRRSQQSSGGLTRAVRPYRWGDPTRLIHWRTSARYGELRVRELEEQTAENQVLIGLDASVHWPGESFEAAVIAAASLYVYSLQRQLSVVLWLPQTGLLQNHHTVLSALAEVMPAPAAPTTRLPAQPLLWLSPSDTVPALPDGSIWVRWPGTDGAASAPLAATLSTLMMTTTQDLTLQLQSDWRQAVEPR